MIKTYETQFKLISSNTNRPMRCPYRDRWMIIVEVVGGDRTRPFWNLDYVGYYPLGGHHGNATEQMAFNLE